MKSACIAFFTFVAAIGWWCDLKEHARLQETRTGRTAAQERAALKKQIAQLQDQARSYETEASPTAGQDVTPPELDLASRFVSRLGDPEVERILTEEHLANTELYFGPFLRDVEQRLTSAQFQQLRSLLVQREAASIDALMLATAQGVQNPQDYRNLTRATVKQLDQQIKATLGPTYDDYQSFIGQQRIGAVVDRMQQVFTAVDAPMTADQYTKMTATIASQNTKPNSRSVPAISSSVVEQSRTFLTDVQAATLVKIKQEDALKAQINNTVFGPDKGKP
jgi:hypothetical protein